MAVKVSDIAKHVGLSAPSVYQILANPNHPRYSAQAKQRVLKAADELGYHPNSAGKALRTKRTGHLGFILSDAVMGGWRNAYYAEIFQGVETACRERGYGLNVTRYNLSNIDSFIFPSKVGQRSVDGLILSGYVEAEVIRRFKKFGIPCVCIGDNLEVARLIPAIAPDIVSGQMRAVQYVAELGHRRIGYVFSPTHRGRELAKLLCDEVRTNSETSRCEIMPHEPLGGMDYDAGCRYADYWMGLPSDKRPTCLISSDQVLVAFMKRIRRGGWDVPRDVSLIGLTDTYLCEYADPGLTAINMDLQNLGMVAVDMLFNHLEHDKPLAVDMSRNDFPMKLNIRESCGRVLE